MTTNKPKPTIRNNLLYAFISISILAALAYLTFRLISGFFIVNEDLSQNGLAKINIQSVTKQINKSKSSLSKLDRQIEDETNPQIKIILSETRAALEEREKLLEEKNNLARGNYSQGENAGSPTTQVIQLVEKIQSLSSESLAASRTLQSAEEITAETQSQLDELKKQESQLSQDLEAIEKEANTKRNARFPESVVNEVLERLAKKKQELTELRTEIDIVTKNLELQQHKVEIAKTRSDLIELHLVWEKKQASRVFTDAFQNFYYRGLIVLPQIIIGFITLLAFWYIGKIIHIFIRRKAKKRQIHRAFLDLSGTIVHIAVVFVGVLVSLVIMGLGSAITTILAGLGVVGLALGLALQDVLKSFFAGIVISIEDPYDIGDIVIIGEHEGKITSIKLRSTTMRTYDNEQVVIPNSSALQSSIMNITRLGVRRLTARVGVAYDTDIDKAKEIGLEILRKNEQILIEPEPMVLVEQFNDSSVGLRFLYWIESATTNKLIINSEVTKSILEGFRENGINIPFPIRTIQQMEGSSAAKSQHRKHKD